MTHTDPSRAGWRKSRRSNNGGNCVEVADLGPAVGIRDSKNPHGPKLTLTRADWTALVRTVKQSGRP